MLLACCLAGVGVGAWLYPQLWANVGDGRSWGIMLALVAASVAAVRRVVVPPLGAAAGSLCSGSSLLLGLSLGSFAHLRPLPVLLITGSVGLLLSLMVGHAGRRFGGHPTLVSSITGPRTVLRGGRASGRLVRRRS